MMYQFLNYSLLNSSFYQIQFLLKNPNIKRLDIELVDYLGNTVDLNGVDWSFTLEFSTVYSLSNKDEYEKKNLVFDSRK